MAKRKAKHLGFGIYVQYQFKKKELVKGDTFQDADYGTMLWDGRKWVNVDDELAQYQKELAAPQKKYKKIKTLI
jgi:hypothetical protein